MEDYQRLSHTKWQCKYHIIFIPKCRRKALFDVVRRELGKVFHRLAEQKGCRIEEGHVMADHVHMLVSIPPKMAVSSVVGYLKGKSAIHVARHFLRRERNYAGQYLWARGYFVDTVGRDTERIRRYIQEQEARDRRLDQLELSDRTERTDRNTNNR
jgi:putative transposase